MSTQTLPNQPGAYPAEPHLYRPVLMQPVGVERSRTSMWARDVDAYQMIRARGLEHGTFTETVVDGTSRCQWVDLGCDFVLHAPTGHIHEGQQS